MKEFRMQKAGKRNEAEQSSGGVPLLQDDRVPCDTIFFALTAFEGLPFSYPAK